MKASAVLWSVVLMIAAIGGLVGCGGSSSQKSTSQKSTSQKSTSQKSTSQKSTSQKSTSQKSTVQKSTVQKSTSQKSTSQKSTSQKSTVQHVLTEDDIPDVLMPGIWTGIKGAYLIEGENRVEIYTTWSDTPEHRLNAQGAAAVAAADLGWASLHDHYVIVYGDWDDLLGSWGSS